MAGHLAICRTCQFAFAFQIVADGANAGLPNSVFCPRCGGTASLSDGSVAGFFQLFNEAFPAATPKRLKREIWALASKIASGQVTPAQVLMGDYRVSDDPEERRFLWTVGVSIAALIVAVLTYLQNERLITSGTQDGKASDLVHAQILEQLHQIAEGHAELYTEPSTSSLDIRGRTPEEGPRGTVASPKPKRVARPKSRRSKD